MVQKNYNLIQSITKALKLNNGKGYSKETIQKVLVTGNRKNADIELIDKIILESEKKTKKTIVENYNKIKEGSVFYLRINSTKEEKANA